MIGNLSLKKQCQHINRPSVYVMQLGSYPLQKIIGPINRASIALSGKVTGLVPQPIVGESFATVSLGR